MIITTFICMFPCRLLRVPLAQYTTSFADLGENGSMRIVFDPDLRKRVTSRRNGLPMKPPACAPLTVMLAASSGVRPSSSR